MAGNKPPQFDSTGDSDYGTLHSGGRSLNVTDDPNSEVNNADGNQELQDQSSNELSASNLSTPAESASADFRENISPRPAPRQSSPIKPQDSSPNSPAKNYDTTGSEGAVGYSSTPSNSCNAPQQTGNERYKDLDHRMATFSQIETIGQPDAAKLSQAGKKMTEYINYNPRAEPLIGLIQQYFDESQRVAEKDSSGKQVSPALESSRLSFNDSLELGDLNSPDEVEAERKNSESSLTRRHSSHVSSAQPKDDNKTEPPEEPVELPVQPEPLDERSVSEPSESQRVEKLEHELADFKQEFLRYTKRRDKLEKDYQRELDSLKDENAVLREKDKQSLEALHFHREDTKKSLDRLQQQQDADREDNLQSCEELHHQQDVSADEHQSTHEETGRKLSSLTENQNEIKDNFRALGLKTNQLENKQERTSQQIYGIKATQNNYQRELDSLKDETADQGAASQKGISNLRQDIRDDGIGIPGASEIPHEEGSSAEEDSSAEDVEPEEEGGEDG